eukprot:6861448-Pyramimonas_sp.AAC.2
MPNWSSFWAHLPFSGGVHERVQSLPLREALPVELKGGRICLLALASHAVADLQRTAFSESLTSNRI